MTVVVPRRVGQMQATESYGTLNRQSALELCNPKWFNFLVFDLYTSKIHRLSIADQ